MFTMVAKCYMHHDNCVVKVFFLQVERTNSINVLALSEKS